MISTADCFPLTHRWPRVSIEFWNDSSFLYYIVDVCSYTNPIRVCFLSIDDGMTEHSLQVSGQMWDPKKVRATTGLEVHSITVVTRVNFELYNLRE